MGQEQSALMGILPSSYGNVLVVASTACMYQMYRRDKVLGLMYRYRIEEPVLSPAPPSIGQVESHLLNCTIRASEKYNEVLPSFLTLLLLTGLQTPRFSSACGAIFLMARHYSAVGFSSGAVHRRLPGTILSMVTLGVMSLELVYIGLKHLGLNDALHHLFMVVTQGQDAVE